VALVVCIGQGVKQQVAGQLGRYGKNVFMVRPGTPQANASLLAGFAGTNSTLLTASDLQTVQKTKGVDAAVPLSTVSGSVTADYTVNAPFIIATTGDFSSVFNQPMLSGGFFGDHDQAPGVVLGMNIAQRLFNDNAPLGQALVWHGQRFLVAGVFQDFKAPPLSLEANFNEAVFVPYAIAQKVTGSVLGVYQILGKASPGSDMAKTVADVNATLVAAHGGAQDVSVVPVTAANSNSDQAIHLLTMLVGGAAIIALVVGGVGIMNIMLVNVTERMYEIGLRKAIGATNIQIMRQFVVEAFVLSTLGALIGVVVSCAMVGLLRVYTSLQAVLVWQVLVAAPLAAITVGMFFGSVPALKAARKDPIAALRHD
jgi:putative ABC transport system permease protein